MLATNSERAGQSPTTSETLADWSTRFRFHEVPDEAVTYSKHLILDAIGVGLVGSVDSVGTAAIRAARDLGDGAATVLGSSRRLAGGDAAFINGTLIHAIDYDDMSFGGHATGCILPAILALGEPTRASGQDLLTAYTVGMEAFGRLSLVSPVDEMHGFGWHPTGVFGVIGAAVAAAKLVGLTEAETVAAIGIAASSGVGLAVNFGTMTKPMHSGHAARSGVLAASLASHGFTSSPSALDGVHAFGSVYMKDKLDWSAFATGLGNPLRITFRGPSIKQFPCCGGNHRAIASILRLRKEYEFAADEVESIEAHIHPRLMNILIYHDPQTGYEGKFSLEFNIAYALLEGKPTVGTFVDAQVSSARIQREMEKVQVIQDGAHPDNCLIRIRLTNGSVLEHSTEVLHGSPLDRLSEAEVIAKFMENVEPILGNCGAISLKDGIMCMDETSSRFWDAWSSINVEGD